MQAASPKHVTPVIIPRAYFDGAGGGGLGAVAGAEAPVAGAVAAGFVVACAGVKMNFQSS